MTQELRDTQATSERLHNQLAEVGCARDRAELKLEMYGSAPFTGFGGSGSRKVTWAQYIADEYPDLVRQGGKIRCETVYPEGGGCVEWITDDDDDDKENWNPSLSSSGHPPLDFSTSFEFNGSSGAGASGSGGGSGGGSGSGEGSSSAARPGSLSPEI
jgi:hypothetical protein